MTTKMELASSWIYSMADYCQIFDLNHDDLKAKIFDYPAGISSFNAEMYAAGYKVVSGDPSYHLSLEEMQVFSQNVFDRNVSYLKEHSEILCGDQSVDSIIASWERHRQLFLNDYETGKKEGRYQDINLSHFPFDHPVFDIALCSNHRFQLQQDVANEECQPSAIVEILCQAANEVRVFPLQNEKGKIATKLGEVMLAMQQKGCGIEVREVPYHDMKGGNAMLRIWSTQCAVEESEH